MTKRRITITFLLAIILHACTSGKKITKLEWPDPFTFSITDTVNETKNTLYLRAYEWAAKSFGSAKAVIEMQDKEAGKLIGKARFTVVTSSVKAPIEEGYVSYVFTIDTKDGKFRMQISNIIHTGPLYSTGGRSTMYGASFGNLADKYDPGKYPYPTGKAHLLVMNKSTIYFNELLKYFDVTMHQRASDF